MKTQFTKQEKSAYFAMLRTEWQKAKVMSEDQKQITEAIMLSHGLKMSLTGFYYVQAQMKAQGLEGIPYIDAKTFTGWKESGFQVKKGEHSTLKGLTWISTKTTDELTGEESNGYTFPKEYHLFHRSQVFEIA